jgi:hypothetical protein
VNSSTPSGSSGSSLVGAADRHDDHIIHRISATGSQPPPLTESGPVFADPSGRRHRVLRYAGFAAMAGLVACLGAVVVAMTGGPQAPFTQWAAQHPPATSASGHVPLQHARSAAPGRGGTGGPSQDAPVAAPAASAPMSADPSPSPGARPSPSATARTPASPANPAGQTPPGHTKSPNPHRSSRAA